MELKDLQPGAPYSMPVQLVTVQGREGFPKETQSVTVRTNDGQAISTNIGNLSDPLPVTVDGTVQAGVDALTAQRVDFETRLQALQTELEQARVSHGSTDTELNEWKTKAGQAEQAARDVALQLEETRTLGAQLQTQLDEARLAAKEAKEEADGWGDMIGQLWNALGLEPPTNTDETMDLDPMLAAVARLKDADLQEGVTGERVELAVGTRTFNDLVKHLSDAGKTDQIDADVTRLDMGPFVVVKEGKAD